MLTLGSATGSDTRNEVKQVIDIAAVERGLDDLSAFDYPFERRAIRLQIRWCGADIHGLGYIAYRQLHVDSCGAADSHIYLALGLKS